MNSHVRAVWDLPAPPGTRGPGRLDVAFVVAVGVVAAAEAALRTGLRLRWLAIAAFLLWLPTLLVRRTRPLLMAGVFAVVSGALMVVGWLSNGAAPDDLNTAVVGLLIPYSLTRWARGRDAVLGLGLFLLVAGTSLLTQPLVAADRLGGAAVVVAAAAVGAAVRGRSLLRTCELDDVRRDERERLARELHDTVAHHLTAIAISAQAGLAVAEARPGAARDALERIGDEATRTLAETRRVVAMLRTEDDERERPLDDLAGLANAAGPGPRIDVDLADGLEDVPPTVVAAVHRIAREAVANSCRHANGATAVSVRVVRDGADVVLTVDDDGPVTTRPAREGYGIVGMSERAALLGGRLAAGPEPDGGWRVSAVLPVDAGGRR